MTAPGDDAMHKNTKCCTDCNYIIRVWLWQQQRQQFTSLSFIIIKYQSCTLRVLAPFSGELRSSASYSWLCLSVQQSRKGKWVSISCWGRDADWNSAEKPGRRLTENHFISDDEILKHTWDFERCTEYGTGTCGVAWQGSGKISYAVGRSVGQFTISHAPSNLTQRATGN